MSREALAAVLAAGLPPIMEAFVGPAIGQLHARIVNLEKAVGIEPVIAKSALSGHHRWRWNEALQIWEQRA